VSFLRQAKSEEMLRFCSPTVERKGAGQDDTMRRQVRAMSWAVGQVAMHLIDHNAAFFGQTLERIA
jgi:hypothetical protein